MAKNSVSAYHDTLSMWRPLLAKGLEEDGWLQDWTTLGTLQGRDSSRSVSAQVVAKSEGTWSASGLVAALNHEASRLTGLAGFTATTELQDGDHFKGGDVVSKWEGPARLVLAPNARS